MANNVIPPTAPIDMLNNPAYTDREASNERDIMILHLDVRVLLIENGIYVGGYE